MMPQCLVFSKTVTTSFQYRPSLDRTHVSCTQRIVMITTIIITESQINIHICCMFKLTAVYNLSLHIKKISVVS